MFRRDCDGEVLSQCAEQRGVGSASRYSPGGDVGAEVLPLREWTTLTVGGGHNEAMASCDPGKRLWRGEGLAVPSESGLCLFIRRNVQSRYCNFIRPDTLVLCNGFVGYVHVDLDRITWDLAAINYPASERVSWHVLGF